MPQTLPAMMEDQAGNLPSPPELLTGSVRLSLGPSSGQFPHGWRVRLETLHLAGAASAVCRHRFSEYSGTTAVR